MQKESVEVLVIGAGPSGCVASAFLHKHNIRVKVIEKNGFPRFVIGESLLPRCMDHLAEVDLLDSLKVQDFEVKRGARFLKDGKVCEFDFSQKYGQGWDWTWQMPRAVFDNAMAEELLKRGVDICFQQEVKNVKFNADGSSKTFVEDNKGYTSEISAKFIIDSSGYGCVLPKILGITNSAPTTKNAAIFTHVKDGTRPMGKEGTLITFDVLSDNEWLWVIPFSNGDTSIGYVGPKGVINKINGNPTDKFWGLLQKSSHYAQRFQDQQLLFEPRVITNASKSISRIYGKGYAITGNSATFIDPIFSSGVTFATESGLLAAKLVRRELANDTVNWEKEYSEYIQSGVSVFSTYVQEWYTGRLQKIFFHDRINPDIKTQICAVLAGYVWDKTNPFVKNHHRLVRTLAHVIDIEKKS